MRLFSLILMIIMVVCTRAFSINIPLPEHPRPDFERAEWSNLNGEWQFEFDAENAGIDDLWYNGGKAFTQTINVPFPWGSPLSGVKDEAKIAWYRRAITVPSEWVGKRVFLVIGASDWQTTGWLDSLQVGEFRGGYTPFEFELTNLVKWGSEQMLTLRVDDTDHSFKLFGKQGYGNARGIWQTVYLEARPAVYLKNVHFYPDIDQSLVKVRATLNEKAPEDGVLEINFKTGGPALQSCTFQKDAQEIEL